LNVLHSTTTAWIFPWLTRL